MIQESIKANSSSIFQISKDIIKDNLIKLSELVNEKLGSNEKTIYEKMLTDFCNKPKSTATFKDLKNYLKINLNQDRIDYMINTLHLGAHKSLTYITQENINNLKDTITAIIELLYLIRISNYPL